MLEIQTSGENNKIVELIGELDIATVDKFKSSIDEARLGATSMVLDMAKLGFVDSTGVGGLLNVIKSLKNNKIDVKVKNITDEVYEVFDLLGLPMLLGKDIFDK